jgi:hypothetical protein
LIFPSDVCCREYQALNLMLEELGKLTTQLLR